MARGFEQKELLFSIPGVPSGRSAGWEQDNEPELFREVLLSQAEPVALIVGSALGGSKWLKVLLLGSGYQCAFALALGFKRCIGYDLLCTPRKEPRDSPRKVTAWWRHPTRWLRSALGLSSSLLMSFGQDFGLSDEPLDALKGPWASSRGSSSAAKTCWLRRSPTRRSCG